MVRYETDPAALAEELHRDAPGRLSEFVAQWQEDDPGAVSAWVSSLEARAAAEHQARVVAAQVEADTAIVFAKRQARENIAQAKHGAPEAVANTIDTLIQSGASADSPQMLRRTAELAAKKQAEARFKANLIGGLQPDGRYVEPPPPDYRLSDDEIESLVPLSTAEKHALIREGITEDESVDTLGRESRQRAHQHFHERDMLRVYGPNWRDFERR